MIDDRLGKFVQVIIQCREGGDHPGSIPVRGISFHETPAQQGHDDLPAGGILGDEGVPLLGGDVKRVVEAGLDAVVDFDIPVLERNPLFLYPHLDFLPWFRQHHPGFRIQVLLHHGIGPEIGVGVFHGGAVVLGVAREHPAIGGLPGEQQDAGVGGRGAEVLRHAEVEHHAGIDAAGKEVPQFLAVTCPHPLVGADVAEMPTLAQQLGAALVEQAVDVGGGRISLVFLPDPDLLLGLGELLDLDIGRIADDDIEALGNGAVEHPDWLEELRRPAGVVGIPLGQVAAGYLAGAGTAHQLPGQFFPEMLVLFLQGELLLPGLGGEVVVADLLQFLLDLLDDRVVEQVALGLFSQPHMGGLVQGDQGVCGNKLGLQVRQRAHAVVLRLVTIGLLVADERDEEPQLGELDGDGLDVYAVQAVLDQVELAAVVVGVVLEGALQFLAHGR